MKRIAVIAALLGALVVAGCTGESSRPEATGEGRIRALNAIMTSPDFQVLIEERTVGGAPYKSTTTPAQYDDLGYTFNFEVQLVLGESRTRVASQFLDVVADMDYTFVISGNIASPTITVWESAIRQWEETETVFESRFAHLAGGVGAVDVYLAPEGTAPVLGEEVGTLSFGEILPPVDQAEGDYVVTVTTSGDPADVLFESDPITRAARVSSIIAMFAPDPNDTGQLAVRAFSETGGLNALTDVNAPTTLRFINASPLLGTTDIFNDDPPTVPLVSGHAYGDVTGDVPVLRGTNSLTYIGATMLEQDVLALDARHTNVFAVDIADEPTLLTVLPDRRSVETFAKFTMIYAANNQTGVDFYIVDADAGLEDQLPSALNLQISALVERDLAAGSYDLYITPNGEQTVIAGPYRIDIALGDIVDLVVIDNLGDPAIVDFVPIPLP